MKIKRTGVGFIVVLMALFCSACTTSTYGQGLQMIPGSESEYLLKVYIGGFSGGETADKTAETEIKKFMNDTSYSSYEILERRHNLVPSYFEYRVRFNDRPASGAIQ